MNESNGTARTGDALTVRDLCVSFHGRPALRDVAFEIADGSITALIGSSGCGKTTVLRCIAGFVRPDAGRIELRGHVMSDSNTFVAPDRRRIGYVPQEGALFTHLDVAGNVAFGIRRRSDRSARVAECLELVGLAGFERRRVDELSGGQQQRVALARALAPRPDLVLMDEPFSALDAALRPEVCADVVDALRESGATAVIVTHDRDEALAVATNMIVMVDGVVAQAGTPVAICGRPASPEVSELLGPLEIVEGTSDGIAVETSTGSIRLDGRRPPRGPVDVIVRPSTAIAFERST